MEICYDNIKVQSLFTNFELMKRKTNGIFTKQVKKRYDQLKAFDTFADYLKSGLGKAHPLKENQKGSFAISVDKNKRLIVFPIAQDTRIKSLEKCRKIIIKGVEDYHGSKVTSYIP